MKLHLVALDRTRRASCGSSLPSSSSPSLVLPTTSLPVPSSMPSFLDQFNASRIALDIHTVLLPLDDPAQHHDRLVVRDLGPEVALTLALYMSQRAFSRSSKCVSGPQTTKSSPRRNTMLREAACLNKHGLALPLTCPCVVMVVE